MLLLIISLDAVFFVQALRFQQAARWHTQPRATQRLHMQENIDGVSSPEAGNEQWLYILRHLEVLMEP